MYFLKICFFFVSAVSVSCCFSREHSEKQYFPSEIFGSFAQLPLQDLHLIQSRNVMISKRMVTHGIVSTFLWRFPSSGLFNQGFVRKTTHKAVHTCKMCGVSHDCMSQCV